MATRARVRASFKRANPEESENRKSKATKRRVYVAGPHHLWHMDGNHKLILFHLVIHGAIDGFSRACVSLGCADNKTFLSLQSMHTVAPRGCEQIMVGRMYWLLYIWLKQEEAIVEVLLRTINVLNASGSIAATKR